MRTTVDLDEDLLSEAKERAARTGRTLSQVVAEALRRDFYSRLPVSRVPLKDLPTSPGGPRPGVDFNNNAALLDLMDSEDE